PGTDCGVQTKPAVGMPTRATAIVFWEGFSVTEPPSSAEVITRPTCAGRGGLRSFEGARAGPPWQAARSSDAASQTALWRRISGMGPPQQKQETPRKKSTQGPYKG